MTEGPWFKFYPSDWLAGTRGMTASETGIYITLVATMYEHDGYLPEDRPRLARTCGSSPAAFNKVLQQLIDAGKIVRVNGRLTQNRVLEELKNRSEKSVVAAEAANARWSNKDNKINDGTHADALQAQSERNATRAGVRSQKPDKEDAAADARVPPLAQQVCQIAGADCQTHANWHLVESAVARWIASGCTEADVLNGVRVAAAKRTAAGQGPPNTPNYFDGPVADARTARLAPMPEGQHHAKPANTQRQDRRYDTDRRRAASAAAVMAGRVASGSDPAGHG